MNLLKMQQSFFLSKFWKLTFIDLSAICSYDRPSNKLLMFLAKHYKLYKYINQVSLFSVNLILHPSWCPQLGVR
jgi:hypothetical protein